jgi:hypothetical protein
MVGGSWLVEVNTMAPCGYTSFFKKKRMEMIGYSSFSCLGRAELPRKESQAKTLL